MGLFQRACETYDWAISTADYTGKSFPLAPVAHVTKQAEVEITVDGSGRFMAARRRLTVRPAGKKGKDVELEPKIVMPVTEASLSRSGTGTSSRPHYLCEQVRFLDPSNDGYVPFVDQLSAWAEWAHHPKLDAILAYVRGGTIMADLVAAGVKLVTTGPGAFKDVVCWRVEGIGPGSGPCWTDRGLMESLTAYHMDRLSKEGRETGLCMVSGEYGPLAAGHAKGVVAKHGNATLIPMNSSGNNRFTYLGRFTDAGQAVSIGYVASQKMHNGLAWLVANEGVMSDGRVFLCWSPQGVKVPGVASVLAPRAGVRRAVPNPVSYKKDLQEILLGWKSVLPDDTNVCFTILDSPSTGCLSVLYYSELPGHEYLDRLAAWADTCKEGGISPSLGQIAQYAYGTPRDGDYSVDNAWFQQQLQRLILCRYEGRPFPVDVKDALVANASKLFLCDRKRKNGKGVSPREKLIRAACAAVRKYRIDIGKEVTDMDLDENLRDRSYLFGRLLAVADHVEGRILYKKEEDRDTTAMRLQSAFVQVPFSTWGTIHKNLGNYLSQLKPKSRTFYKDLIGKIEKLFETNDMTERNMPLDEMYLLGYYAQRAKLREWKGDDEDADDVQGNVQDGQDVDVADDNDNEEE